MKKRMTLWTALVGAALLMAAMPVVAASKAERTVVKTGDHAPGGQVEFEQRSDGKFRLRACDAQVGDGYGVRAYASYEYEKYPNIPDRMDRVKKTDHIAKDTGGAKGLCKRGRPGKGKWTPFVRARPGEQIHVQVCLKDHDGNIRPGHDRKDHYCGPVKHIMFPAQNAPSRLHAPTFG